MNVLVLKVEPYVLLLAIKLEICNDTTLENSTIR